MTTTTCLRRQNKRDRGQFTGCGSRSAQWVATVRCRGDRANRWRLRHVFEALEARMDSLLRRDGIRRADPRRRSSPKSLPSRRPSATPGGHWRPCVASRATSGCDAARSTSQHRADRGVEQHRLRGGAAKKLDDSRGRGSGEVQHGSTAGYRGYADDAAIDEMRTGRRNDALDRSNGRRHNRVGVQAAASQMSAPRTPTRRWPFPQVRDRYAGRE